MEAIWTCGLDTTTEHSTGGGGVLGQTVRVHIPLCLSFLTCKTGGAPTSSSTELWLCFLS